MLKNLLKSLLGLQGIFAIITAVITQSLQKMEGQSGKFGELLALFWQIVQDFFAVMTDSDPDNARQIKELYHKYRWRCIALVLELLLYEVEKKSEEGEFESLLDQRIAVQVAKSAQELAAKMQDADEKKSGLASSHYEPQSFPPPSRS